MNVGCVMPTYNQRQYIEEAIASVEGQVDDLVIVNDGSTDGTRELLDEREGVWHQPSNLGTAQAINLGRRYVTADWLTWVSSDNVHEPNWMSSLLNAVDPDVGAVYSGYWWGDKEKFTPYDPERLINQTACYFGPSFIIREDVWQPHRGKISHDYDNWLRVEEACWDAGLRIVGIRKPLCRYRVHDERVTVTRKHEFDATHWQREARKRRAVRDAVHP